MLWDSLNEIVEEDPDAYIRIETKAERDEDQYIFIQTNEMREDLKKFSET